MKHQLQTSALVNKNKTFVLTVIVIAMVTVALLPVKTTDSVSAQINQSISAEQLDNLERKVFQRTYENDPISKRLQRLELLAFGATQYGSNFERWQRIQKNLRNKNDGLKNNRLSQVAPKHNDTSASLNELEKYVFKKTSSGQSASARLDKLETKLFGKTSNAMPTDQRIARLERTLGIASTPQQMAEASGMPPSSRSFNMPYFHHGQPGMPNTFGFGFNRDDMNDPDLSQFESQMSQMFDAMERQMQEQMRQQGKTTPNPRQMPYYNAPQIIPQPKVSPDGKVPAYSDPNFI